MEKRLVLFLVLSLVIIVVWSNFVMPPPPKTDDSDTAQETGGRPAVGTEEPGREEPTGAGTGSEAPAADGWPTPIEPGAGRTLAFGDDRSAVAWTLDSRGGSVRTARLKARDASGKVIRKYTARPDRDEGYPVLSEWMMTPRPNSDDAPKAPPSMTVTVLMPEGERDLSGVEWNVESGIDGMGRDRVLYWCDTPVGRIEKEYGHENGEGGFHLLAKVRVRGAPNPVRLRLTGPGSVPVPSESGLGQEVIGAVMLESGTSIEEFDPGDGFSVYPEAEDQAEDQRVRWVGVHGQFFGAILEAKDPKAIRARQAVFIPTGGEKGLKSLGGAIDFEIASDQEAEFRFYAGPMDPDVFSDGPYTSFEPIIDYFLESIAGLLLFVMGVIHSVARNWGVAIIILTLLVRFAMFPLSRKQQVSMRKHQREMMRVKPKMDALKAKYKDNRKKMNEEMMKLYREENVKVLPAGCLVIFLQMPIFIGLFQALKHSVDLRHARFLWAGDLTAADCLAGPFAVSLPILGNCLNLFPILMGVTWYISSAMQPKPEDPQQAQTMKMMKIMPIIFTVMLYNYAAGLAIYMTVSSTWAIFELKVIRKYFVTEEEVAVVASPNFRKGR